MNKKSKSFKYFIEKLESLRYSYLPFWVTLTVFLIFFIFLYLTTPDDGFVQEAYEYKTAMKRITPLERPNQTYEKPKMSDVPNVYQNFVLTNNPTNKKVNYFFFVPESLKNAESYPIIFFIPGYNGDAQYELHEGMQEFAQNNGFAIAGITFRANDEDFENYVSYQYPYSWAAGAFLDILENLKKDGVNYSNVYLHGFSAGAQFAGRTALLLPDKIKGCVILASGGCICPNKYIPVKFMFALGADDDAVRHRMQKVFINAAKKEKIDAIAKVYPNVGHDVSEQEMKDTLEFILSLEKSDNNH